MKDILITSSFLILVLLLLRRLFRNTISRRMQYALWGLVLVRLLMPFSLPSPLSVLNATRPVEQTVAEHLNHPIYYGYREQVLPEEMTHWKVTPEEIATLQDDWVNVSTDENRQTIGYLVRDPETNTITRYASMVVGPWEFLSLLWKAGMVLVGSFFLLSNLLFYVKLRKNRTEWTPTVSRKVYLVPEGVLPSPCLFLNAIYLTPTALRSEESIRHVLCHEEAHAKHWDPLWSLLRCVCLTVYWFDPLVWVAAACAKTDCELACDEAVLEKLGEAERISYGQTLLSLIPVKRGNPLLTATTMTAGKRQLKDRITRIAQKPRQLLAAVAAVAILLLAVSACTLTGGEPIHYVSPSPSASVAPEPSPTPGTDLTPAEEMETLYQQITSDDQFTMTLILEGNLAGSYPAGGWNRVSSITEQWTGYVWEHAEQPDLPPGTSQLIFSRADESLVFYDLDGLVEHREGENSRWYRALQVQDNIYAGLYPSLRRWYDETELNALQQNIAIPDDGRNIDEIAQAWVEAYEGARLQASPGSWQRWTYMKVIYAKKSEDNIPAHEELDENTVPIVWSTVFVPEINTGNNFMAGSTDYYTGDDPDIPAGALQWWLCGYLHRNEDGFWCCDGGGTGW